MQLPETRYARSDEVSIAYQVTGDGPFDLVFVPGFVSNVELAWTVPVQASAFRRLASFCRLIRFDKRGTGMSDRVAGAPDLETRMDDVRAVMDAVGSRRAALIGVSEGGPMSILFAATYPERTWALVLYETSARSLWAPDYQWGEREDDWRREVDEEMRHWGDPVETRRIIDRFAPTADTESKRSLAVLIRQSSSPGTTAALHRMNAQIDVRNVLPAIRVPTLVMSRVGGDAADVGASRYLAEHIPRARHVELPGVDHAFGAGDSEAILQEVELFLTGAWEVRAWDEGQPDRVLATLLFTDIVDSTRRAAEVGDRAWRELLERHHAVIRRELMRFRGEELDTAGDGFFARFDGPARAIRCAQAVTDAVHELGIEVRAGLHTGECELFEQKVGGIAVSIGARVCAEAGPDEVLVSSTVKDLVAGSGLAFEERGVAELKGVPGEWRLYAVAR